MCKPLKNQWEQPNSEKTVQDYNTETVYSEQVTLDRQDYPALPLQQQITLFPQIIPRLQLQ